MTTIKNQSKCKDPAIIQSIIKAIKEHQRESKTDLESLNMILENLNDMFSQFNTTEFQKNQKVKYNLTLSH